MSFKPERCFLIVRLTSMRMIIRVYRLALDGFIQFSFHLCIHLIGKLLKERDLKLRKSLVLFLS